MKSSRRKHSNSRIGCATCKRRRIKCPEDLPECSNCIRHQVRCDYLDMSEQELAEIAQKKKNRLNGMLTQDRKRAFSSSPSSTNSFSREGYVGSPLAGAATTSISFKKIKHEIYESETYKFITSQDYMENILLSKLKLHRFSLTSELVLNSILALVAYYLRSNTVKSFEGFSLANKSQALHLRSTLLNIATKYYGHSISLLRSFILLPKYDVSVALIASTVLNSVALYEYKSLYYLITYSHGIISIFNDILVNKKDISKEVPWSANFVICCSKSVYFPPYNPRLLIEFKSYIMSFGSLILGDTSPSIKYHFNILSEFTSKLIRICQENTIDGLKQKPSVLYMILRKWFLILPSKVRVLNYLKDPLEKCLMHLFSSLTSILNNLFPIVIFLFLQSFDGGVPLWYKQSYKVSNTAFDGSLYSQKIKQIETYCIRVSTFFRKRFNILSSYFNDLKTDTEDLAVEISRSINEIPISSFTDKTLKYYNYPHFLKDVKIDKSDDVQYNLHHIFDSSIFDYNPENYQHFLSSASDSSRDDSFSDNYIHNDQESVGNLNLLSGSLKSNDIIPPDSDHRNLDSSIPPPSSDRLHLAMFFDEGFCLLAKYSLANDYQHLFKYGHSKQSPIHQKLNTNTGLLYEDADPLQLLKGDSISTVLARKERDLINTDIFNSQFYGLRTTYLNDASRPNEEDSERYREDPIYNFYDDLNDSYFK